MSRFDFAEYFRNRSQRQRDLNEFRSVLKLLGDPQDTFRSVHIAGTNGKGSTSAYLASILCEAGIHTGLYTSPALVHISERICIDGEPVPDHLIAEQAERVSEAEKLSGYELVGFDRMTATALCIFEQCGVEYAVLEAGLGGRLDATNAVEAELAMITSISRDHTQVLGNSYEQIAAEKCGIIKPHQTVVVHPQRPEAMDVIEEFCEEQNARMVCVSDCGIQPVSRSPYGQCFDLYTEEGCYSLHTCMLGEHQLENASAAVLAARELGIDNNAILRGIDAMSWPGRMEYFDWDPDILIDGAHNPQGMRVLVKGIEDFFPQRHVVAIVGIMRDKDYETMLKRLVPRVDHLIAVAVNERSLRPEEIVFEAERFGVASTHIADTVGHAYEAALRYCIENYEDQPLIVVAGSLYLAGALRELLV